MKRFYLIGIAVFAAFLLGQNRSASAQTDTFHYTGSMQTYTVAPCVTSIIVDARGATGGRSHSSIGGAGGRVQCTLAVTPGAVLQIYVGGQGDSAVYPGPTTGGAGGYNGGAPGEFGYSDYAGGGGGGASDIRLTPYTLTDRAVVAAGGGGAGYDYTPGGNPDKGGDGGGLTGQNGSDGGSTSTPHVGGGGTPTAGGLGGVYGGWTSGNPGTFGMGGDCDSTGGTLSHSGGGGGGGGWYGGGGGSWGGGGGGSSYTVPATTGVADSSGYDSLGNGMVIITRGCSPIGTITGAALGVCLGATATLSDPSSVTCGTWSSSNTAIAGIGSATGIVTGVAVGTATITYNITNPCGGTPAVRTISIDPFPAAITGATEVCIGATTTLTDATSFGGWISTAPTIATIGLTTGVVTGISTGTANIDYTLLTGCMASTTVTVDCIDGVPQTLAPGKQKVDIFPNPASSELTIKMQDGAYNTFTITNNVGQILMQQKITNPETQINVKELAPAIYYITFRGDNGTTVKRFVKME